MKEYKCRLQIARNWFNNLTEVDKWNFTINHLYHYDKLSDESIIILYNIHNK